MKVILADDHAMMRAGLRALLENLEGVEIVAETGDGREAVTLIATHQPDVAILDISMPGLNGIEVAGVVRESSPRTRILMLSMHAEEGFVARALRAGVSGYLLKDSAPDELSSALRALSRGDSYLSPAISRQVVEGFLKSDQPADPLASLTQRQREVLQLVAEGLANKEIAARLELSVKTVEAHRTQIMGRLGIHDVAGLVRLAIRAGLVPPE